MADNSTTAAAHPAIPLMANSYNFQALLKASEHAEGLKTDDGQAAAFGVIPATAGALIQELVDVATILAALRAIGGRLDAREAAAEPRAGPAPVSGARRVS